MMDVIYAIGVVVLVLAVILFVDQLCYGGRSSVYYKRLRRPTDTTLGKPAETEISFNRALDEIHRAARYGKPRQ